MPTPQQDESKDAFIERCIPMVLDEGTADDNEQAVAVCNSMWDEAKEQASEMEILREFQVHEFKGSFPNVPLAPGVNLEELKETDDDPMFVTLPIVPEIGAVSRSGLLYDEALADKIAEQIQKDKPGGQYGHLEKDKRSTEYRKAEAFWVGAMRQGNTLWGKAYVPPGEARDDIRRKKAVGGRIATSIYGPAKYERVKPGVRRATAFTLESLDFAPPERAALGYGATPHITAEMNENEQTGDDDMPTKEEVLAELTANDLPASLRETIVAEWQKENQHEDRISELEEQVEDRDTLINELQDQLAQHKVREFDATLDNVVAETIDWNVDGDEAEKKVDAFRRTYRARILAELDDERDPETVEEIAAEVWDEMKPLAETLRDALSGPAAVVSGKVNGRHKVDDSPEAIAAARAKTGI